MVSLELQPISLMSVCRTISDFQQPRGGSKFPDMYDNCYFELYWIDEESK